MACPSWTSQCDQIWPALRHSERGNGRNTRGRVTVGQLTTAIEENPDQAVGY